MEIPRRGMSFQFKRTYRSRIIYPSCYGFNWSHNYDRRFVSHPEQENVVVFYNGYARGDAYYVDSGSGNLIPPEYHFRKVITGIKNGSAFVRILNGLNGVGLNGARHHPPHCRTLRKKFCKMRKKIAIFAQPNRYVVQPSVIIRNYFLLFH